MTFDDLCRIEPRLDALRLEAEGIARNGIDINEAREVWHGNMVRLGLKARMMELVGSRATVAELASPCAYRVAYAALWDILTGGLLPTKPWDDGEPPLRSWEDEEELVRNRPGRRGLPHWADGVLWAE
jgi:hypothetical protein